MTGKDRLIELIRGAKKNTKGANCDLEREHLFADYLIENGVIVLPCKVGDIVYYPYEYGGKILEKTIKKIVIEKEYRWLDVGVSFLPFENIGETVFLTKEEAEQKLRKEDEGE
jgi:hypothetical protein